MNTLEDRVEKYCDFNHYVMSTIIESLSYVKNVKSTV